MTATTVCLSVLLTLLLFFTAGFVGIALGLASHSRVSAVILAIGIVLAFVIGREVHLSEDTPMWIAKGLRTAIRLVIPFLASVWIIARTPRFNR